MPEVNNNRKISFDFLRMVGSIYIVAYWHLYEYLYDPTGHYLAFIHHHFDITRIILGIFTLISGYCLASKYTFNGIKDVIGFYRKRLLRFYPLFLIASISMFLLGLNNLNRTLKGVIGISSFLEPQQSTLWYISMLVFFYFLVPFFCNRKYTLKKKIVLLSFLYGIIIGLELIFNTIDDRIFFHLFIFFIALQIGSLCSNEFFDIIKKRLSWLLLLGSVSACVSGLQWHKFDNLRK